MNDFVTDAIHNFERTARLISPKMSAEEIEDAIIFFSFGVERVFKGILYDVNPSFVLESDSFDNVLSVLYRDRLVEPHRSKVQRDASKPNGANYNLLPFKASMFRAARFSKSVEDNIGVFTKLSDLRGIVAHRSLSQLDYGNAHRLLQRLFFPVTSAFAEELQYPVTECLQLAQVDLKALSKKILAEDQFISKTESLLERHREEWDKLKDDQAHVEKANRETRAAYRRDSWHDTQKVEYTCPACENMGILSIDADWDCEGSRGDAWITGIYVAGFECLFCGLQLDDYEQFDYLKMNEYLSGE